jgi:poly(3-hydroxybutyrate) depolymerase
MTVGFTRCKDVFRYLPLGGIALSIFAIAMGSVRGADDSLGEWQWMKPIQPKGYVCGKINEPIAIDGKLEEAAWAKAPWTDDFVDIEGDKKPKPRQRTRAKMIWDANNLYIAAELSEDHLQASLTEHDSVIFHDNDFEVFIDPDGDHHDYLEFEMNALNTTWDLRLPKPYKDGGKADDRFEFVGLKSAVHLEGTLNQPSDRDQRWTLEIAIPWASMTSHSTQACPPIDGARWRINFSRVEWMFDTSAGNYAKVPNRREDNWVWSPQGIVDMHRPERWGVLQFTQSPPGESNLSLPAEREFREALMEIYHRQRVFESKQKRWAVTTAELGIQANDAPLLASVSIQLDDQGYRASLKDRSSASASQWNVRQDSLLWRSYRDLRSIESLDTRVRTALEKSGSNRSALEMAWEQCPPNQIEGLEFLLANMPSRDLQSLSTAFLLENTRLAYEAWDASPWKDRIPKEIFLNNVLPYANINERRDAWRREFRERFLPLISGATSPSQAAAMLNQKLFPLVKVKYSTQRAKADQSPVESIKSGLASCTGLSILLIDACRACGIPARFVGTPLWSDNSGNHSWVEVWDQGWHFTGAAEPSGDALDRAWFVDRASKAVRDNEMNAIYAVSFQRTPISFPLVWDRSIDYVHAVNVTDRYTKSGTQVPEGKAQVMFRVSDSVSKQRLAASLTISDAAKQKVFEGTSKDERFDANDHLVVLLALNQEFEVEARFEARSVVKSFRVQPDNMLIQLQLPGPTTVSKSDARPEKDSRTVDEALRAYLAQDVTARPTSINIPEFSLPITRDQAATFADLIWADRAAQLRSSRADEMKSEVIRIRELSMPFAFKVFGEKPAKGHSLYISMHGGGGAPARVNQNQWENQKKLYTLEEGIYVAPRAPTDTWDLWHQSHMDEFLQRLIENFVVFHGIDQNRVYLMGYSAGGDGVFQLAPRMADRFAAAAMMAGHPNETSPLGLRNLPFTLHMGENDADYNRNKVASEWAIKLADLQKQDPNGYKHFVKLHPGKGHWMDRQDAEALPWMASHTRTPFPDRIVWKQDDVVEKRFYWLGVADSGLPDRALVIAQRKGQTIDIESSDVKQLSVLLSDEIVNLDEPIEVTFQGKPIFQGVVPRTIAQLWQAVNDRLDRPAMYSAKVDLSLNP